MAPELACLPAVLPTDRLTASARPVPAVREGLRHIASVRNGFTVAYVWMQIVLVAALAVWLGRGWWAVPVYLAAIVLMGRSFAQLLILAHEAAHRLLFGRRRVNDLVGAWLLAYPGFTPIEAYRRGHMAHHRDEMGPDEPDLALYRGYPIEPASFRRKLVRDAVGISGWKNLRPLFSALRRPSSRPAALRILAAQAVLIALCVAVGHPWLYLLLWLAPWMTSWRVINRLRALAEHGGMIGSPDRRLTTHHVEQHWLARFWMVPFHTGWHLAHHVDAGIPWRNLPALHAELVAAGWVTPAFTYPNYRSLWRALRSPGG